MPTAAIVPRLRRVTSVYAAPEVTEGEGFRVRRALPGPTLEAIGPFIFLDHLGPIDFAPGAARGAPDHPHAGMETLTYLLEGSSTHRDSMGNDNVMAPGEAQWMRAGRGVVHAEMPSETIRREGGRLHGVQLWINLPRAHKATAPAYRHVKATEIPVFRRAAATVRLIAGAFDGRTGPIETLAAPWLAHVSLPGGGVTFPIAASELAVYVLTGGVRVGAAGASVAAGGFAVLGTGDELVLAADFACELLVLGGDPLDTPIIRHGPFVMNDMSQIEAAIADYRAGRMGRIAATAG